MTRSSIHHLFIHTSCPSIHYWSFSSRYHWPLPICFPNSSAPGRLHSFLQTSILSIDPHSDIYTVYISPSFPWLLIPVERLFMARLNTLHQRQSLQDADAKTQRHRFHSSLSNSNDLGESVPSMRREKRQSAGLRERLRGAGREKKLQGFKSNNNAEGGKCGGTEQEAKRDETMIDTFELAPSTSTTVFRGYDKLYRQVLYFHYASRWWVISLTENRTWNFITGST